eukprot:8096515-Heterocapsa_arctica.AAC.1
MLPGGGDERDIDFFLVSHCLRNCVAGYDALPRGNLPTHRPVRLILQLGGLTLPTPPLRKPRSVMDSIPERNKTVKGEEPEQYGPDWGEIDQPGPTAQQSCDTWSKKAE